MSREQGERREAAGPDAAGSAARDGRAGLALFPAASLLPAPFFSPSLSRVLPSHFSPRCLSFSLSAPLFPLPNSHFSSVSLICSCSPPFSLTPLFSLVLPRFSFALSRFNCPHSPLFSFHFFLFPLILPHFSQQSPTFSLSFHFPLGVPPFSFCFSPFPLSFTLFSLVSLIFFQFFSFPPPFPSFSPQSPSFPPQFLFYLQYPMFSLIFSLNLIFFQFLSFPPTLPFPPSFSFLSPLNLPHFL